MAFLHSDGPTEPTHLMVVELADDGSFAGEPRTVSGEWDYAIGEHRWSPDGATIRFTSAVRGTSHLWEIDAEGGEVRPVTRGERLVGSLDETPDWSLLAYTSTDAHTPAEVFVARGDGTAEERLTGFNDGWVGQVVLNPAEEITWRVSDGTEIQGWVIPPVQRRAEGRHPMVLKAHGGPHAMYGHTFFQTFHVLSAAGFYVFYPNPRGSSGYGHDFMYATLGSWGLVDEEDFLTGVDAVLERYPDIDPSRIGVSGGSYGGYVTNWLTARSDRFAAAVTSRSIANLEYLWGTSDALGTLEQEFFDPPWEEYERYRAASPIHYVQNVTAPTLIIHSEYDHRTPMQDAEQWFLSLERMGVPVEFVRYPRSSHGLSRTGEPWLLVDRLVRLRSWFEHWLLDGVAADRDW
jgi:dipeptidyl aminopeptidase/acylaminoacyl peptidase